MNVKVTNIKNIQMKFNIWIIGVSRRKLKQRCKRKLNFQG